MGYYNAGTVEFIFDLHSNKHYFMEMNTRLQVEHPISEMITREDLVEWQFLVASGFPLPKQQKDIIKKGHAIEVRVYSEDPFNNFLPGSGKLSYFQEPVAKDMQVRIETGVRENDTISIFYDPMIAKLITFADTREKAIAEMSKALTEYRVVGLPTNLKFLKNVLNNEVFHKGDYDTGFIEKNTDKLLHRVKEVDTYDLASAVAVKLASSFKNIRLPKELISFCNGRHLSMPTSVKASATFFEKDIVTDNFKVEVLGNNRAKLILNGKKHEVKFELHSQNKITVTCDGHTSIREFYTSGENVYLFDQSGDTIEFNFKSNELTLVKREQ